MRFRLAATATGGGCAGRFLGGGEVWTVDSSCSTDRLAVGSVLRRVPLRAKQSVPSLKGSGNKRPGSRKRKWSRRRDFCLWAEAQDRINRADGDGKMFGLSFILDSSITGGHKQAQYPPSAPEYRPGRHPRDRSEGGGQRV